MGNTQTASPEAIDSVPICSTCGSERVARDAWACFNRESGLWELEHVFDDGHCHACDRAARLNWITADAFKNKRIRELNDRFRTQGQGNGTVLITAGVQENGEEFIAQTVEAIKSFSAFSEENDPWGEHDFGAVEIAGDKIFFKLDYYDPTLKHGSSNPANEALTHRVMTIMLASEY